MRVTVPSETRTSTATRAVASAPSTMAPTAHSPIMCVRFRNEAVV